LKTGTKNPKRPKRSRPSVASAGQAELVFVVDVSSLTKEGFVGTTKYEGNKVDLEFDDGGAGIFLTSEMASRLHVRKGSALSITIEDEQNQLVEAQVAGIGRVLRISDQKIYYAVGREGGAILRIRKKP
jgi:ABC-type lipoprotein release transport system permease subunit